MILWSEFLNLLVGETVYWQNRKLFFRGIIFQFSEIPVLATVLKWDNLMVKLTIFKEKVL